MKTLTRIMYYVPKKFLIKLIFFLFLLLSFNIYVNAESLTTYNHTYNLEYGTGSCGSSNKYTYMIEDTVMGGYQTYSGNVGSTYDGKSVYFAFDFNYDLSANTYYDVKINAMLNDFTQNITSSSISIGNGTSCGSQLLNNISLVSLKKSASSGQYKTLTIRIFSATAVDFWTIIINNENYNSLTGVSNFGISSLSITEVDMSNTDAILDNQNSNTNSIINNNNSNTNDIINNQNQNNEELKDTINENFNSCRPSKNLFPGWVIGTGINANTGAIVSNDSGAISSDYIAVDFDINPYYTLTGLTTNLRTFVAGYNSNKEFLGRTGANYAGLITFDSSSFSSGSPSAFGEVAFIRITSYNPREGTIESNIDSIKTMLNVGSSALPYEPYGEEICSNKLDDTNDKLDNLNGTLNDSTPPDTESFMEHLDDLFYDGPISTLILMPLTLINHYVDGFNSTCSPINLGSLYGTELKLPCVNLESKLGSSLWTTIDGLVSIFMIYNICMLFVSVFNDITSLRDTFDTLYVPQHGKPLGKHTSETY